MAANQPPSPQHDAAHAKPATASDIAHYLVDVDSETVEAILQTDATLGDLLTAIAWADGATDVMGQERRALEGPAALVYDIITADEEGDEPRP